MFFDGDGPTVFDPLIDSASQATSPIQISQGQDRFILNLTTDTHQQPVDVHEQITTMFRLQRADQSMFGRNGFHPLAVRKPRGGQAPWSR